MLLGSADDNPQCPEGPGLFLVYRVSDGVIEQKRRTRVLLNQYPAVGMLNDKLTVVLGMGANGLPSVWVTDIIKMGLPSFLQFQPIVDFIFYMQFNYAWVRRALEMPVYQNNTIVAFEAATGKELWSYTEEPWDHFASAGDEEGMARRQASLAQDPRNEYMCAPDAWTIPIITGDGTVYVGSGLTPNLYAIKDRNGDGKLESSEIATFTNPAGSAWLNSPALAPGVLVGAPCWGPMYAWRDVVS